MVQVRSRESIMREAEELTHDPEFKGYINDVGGPTANFFKPACKKQLTHGVCKNRRCLWPDVCRNMDTNEDAYADLLRDLRQIPGVKKVFVRSGIRFDYTMADASDKFLVELLQHHVSGQLRLAPEHVSDAVLSVMGKPRREVYDAFVERFERLSAEYGLKQYVVPYLISSHPGSTMKEAVELAEAVRDMGYMPEQVQDFYPTPSTMSTCMFYTGVDPRTMKPVYIPRDPHEKAMQRALIQYRKPENYKLVKEALRKAGRVDLIGYGAKSASSAPCRPSRARAAERSRSEQERASPPTASPKKRQVGTRTVKPPRSPKIAPSAAPRHAPERKARPCRTGGRAPSRTGAPAPASQADAPPARAPRARTPTPATVPRRGARRKPALTARRHGGANQDIRRAGSGGPRPRPPRAKCPVPPPHPAASQWHPVHRTSSRAVRTPLFPLRTSRRRAR